MKTKIIYLIIAAVVVIAVLWIVSGMPPAAAPSSGNPSAGASPSPSTTPVSPAVPITPASSPSAEATSSVQSAYFSQRTSASLGTYLTDENGMTLYTYTKDTSGVSNCTGACLTAWPPYGPGVSASGTYHLPMLPVNVDTIAGNNGMLQFTWKGMPLYYYAKDKAPGDTLGQGVGGAWYVVQL